MPATNSVNQNTQFDLSKFFKRSFLLISSSVLRLITQLIIIFIFSRELSVTDYGIYQSIWLYVNTTSVIGLFGLPSLILSSSAGTIQLWIAKHKVKFVTLSLALNLVPFFYILSATKDYDTTIKLLLIILCLVQNISIIAESITIKRRQEKLILLANLIFSIGFLISHLCILYWGYSLPLLLMCIIALYFIKAILLNINSIKLNTVTLNSTSKTLGKQWIYLGLNDVAGIVFKWLDKWLILSLISVTQFAVYFNGSYEIPVFGLMLSAVSNIILVDLAAGNIFDINKIKSLFQNSSQLLASVVFPSFCFLFFYSQSFFTFIFSEKYSDAIPIFLISIFILPTRITNYTAVLQVNNRTDIILKGAMLDLLLAVIFMAVLYPVWQLKGLALAFVLSTYIQAAYYLWYTSKIINKRISYFFPFKILVIIMSLSVAVTGLFYYWFKMYSSTTSMLLGIIICFLLISLFLLFQFKKKNERNILHS